MAISCQNCAFPSPRLYQLRYSQRRSPDRLLTWSFSLSHQRAQPRAPGGLNEAGRAAACAPRGAETGPAGTRPPRLPWPATPRAADYISQVPARRAARPASISRVSWGLLGVVVGGQEEDGVQDPRGAAAGEEYRCPLLPLRVRRGEHEVRGRRGQRRPRGGLGMFWSPGLCPAGRPRPGSRL